jgi:hypothetical protein
LSGGFWAETKGRETATAARAAMARVTAKRLTEEGIRKQPPEI